MKKKSKQPPLQPICANCKFGRQPAGSNALHCEKKRRSVAFGFTCLGFTWRLSAITG